MIQNYRNRPLSGQGAVLPFQGPSMLDRHFLSRRGRVSVGALSSKCLSANNQDFTFASILSLIICRESNGPAAALALHTPAILRTIVRMISSLKTPGHSLRSLLCKNRGFWVLLRMGQMGRNGTKWSRFAKYSACRCKNAPIQLWNRPLATWKWEKQGKYGNR